MGNTFGRGYFATPPITLNLIIANVVVFLACKLLPIGDLIYDYGMLYWVGSDRFHLYQFFSYMFLHADTSHIFFNMFSLWMFGRMLEYDLGPRRYMIYYLVCGVGAALLQTGVTWLELISFKSSLASQVVAQSMSPDMISAIASRQFANHVMLGASGAVMGGILAFGVLHPNSMIMLMIPPIPMKAKWFVVIFLVLELVMGVVGVQGSVAHFAHVGGMLWGWLLLRYWRRKHQIFY